MLMSLLLLWNCGKANFMRKPHRPVLVQTPVETEGDGLASRTLADPEKLDRPLKHFENADFRFFFFLLSGIWFPQPMGVHAKRPGDLDPTARESYSQLE